MGAMKLAAKTDFCLNGDPFVAVIEQPGLPFRAPYNHRVYLARDADKTLLSDVRAILVSGSGKLSPGTIRLPNELDYLQSGDILRFDPSQREIRVLFRVSSRHNVLFLTERCNSRCVMCSQPPRDVRDDYLVDDVLRMIPWIPKNTPELGITGGEPTLLYARLIEVLEAAKQHLPSTALHLLSNGRLFCYLRYAERVAAVQHPDLMVGVPLYADTASTHDYVVQAMGAFDQTVLGLLNLGRVGLRVEIRMVIHRETYRRLPQFARFVARNLPFVVQVVFMGLEPTGYARSNLDALWIDPADYQAELGDAVDELAAAGLTVGILNHPLCLLRPALQAYAFQSISDWKNVFMPECAPCTLKNVCCCFFASAALRRSAHIQPQTFLASPSFPKRPNGSG